MTGPTGVRTQDLNRLQLAMQKATLVKVASYH